MERTKTRYVIQCLTIGGRWDSGGKWEDDYTARSLAEAREVLAEKRDEMVDPKGEIEWRYRLVERKTVVTETVLED